MSEEVTKKKYHCRDVNLTKEAEIVLNEIKKMLKIMYTNSEVVEHALVVLYKLIKKYKYEYLSECVSHEF